MFDSCLLVARDYWGSVKAVDSAEAFRAVLLSRGLVNAGDIRTLYGDAATLAAVQGEYRRLIEAGGRRKLALLVGHGDQVPDAGAPDERDGLDEVYRLPDGDVIDDDLTALTNRMARGDFLLLVCDFCSSGTMLDAALALPGVDWVNVSSCQPAEDSYASGEGNVMLRCLLALLERADATAMTTRELERALCGAMRDSFIGDLQRPCVSVSSDVLWEERPLR